MFTIEDATGHDWIEIRRNPCSGDTSFSGFVPESTHIRLVNHACYEDNPIGKLRSFLIRHRYIFKRIFRIDVCYDFERFDSGDIPAKFAQRYIRNVYTKINQCRISAFGADNWSTFDWETLSWGARSSMISTKFYNKTKELETQGDRKPYIVYSWFESGLIDDPVNKTKRSKNGNVYKPEIWRIEFSMKSSTSRWIAIEDQTFKHARKTEIPHTLDLFDSRDKLWHKFEELAFHYFRFKIYKPNVRKDRCPDKILFNFNSDRTFYKAGALPYESKPEPDDMILKRKLAMYKLTHANPDVRNACDAIIEYINSNEAKRYTERHLRVEAEALQAVIRMKMGGDERSALQLLDYVRELITRKEIF